VVHQLREEAAREDLPASQASLRPRAGAYHHWRGGVLLVELRAANARVLILTHVSPRYEDSSVIVADAKQMFSNSYMAEDFFTFDVPLPD